MTDTEHRDAWLHRIGYDGPLAPTLDTLRSLVAAHAMSIPFECIDPLLGRPPALDPESLRRKLIDDGRGGYCCEQNMLFRAGLQMLGFQVTSLLARVIHGAAADAPRPATHMVLRVNLPEGPFLADVGFGGMTLTAPLALTPDVLQETPHETVRLIAAGNDLILQGPVGGMWENIYRVLPEPRQDADFAVANWFTATHPASLFLSNLIVARPGPDGERRTMLNGRLTIRRRSGIVERRMVDNEADLAAVLRRWFGLTLSGDQVAAVLDALDRKGTRGVAHPLFP
jgi:N-hydroxyarylamine O-acetyltransferase